MYAPAVYALRPGRRRHPNVRTAPALGDRPDVDGLGMLKFDGLRFSKAHAFTWPEVPTLNSLAGSEVTAHPPKPADCTPPQMWRTPHISASQLSVGSPQEVEPVADFCFYAENARNMQQGTRRRQWARQPTARWHTIGSPGGPRGGTRVYLLLTLHPATKCTPTTSSRLAPGPSSPS